MTPIGDLIKGGLSGLITGVTDGASKLISNFKADPTKVIEHEEAMEKLKNDAIIQAGQLVNQAEEIQAKELESVNATMRDESKSEHFLVFSWRPLIGYCFILLLINNYVIMPYFTQLKPIVIPENVWMAILAILGVASAGRSVTKWQTAKNNQN